MNKTSIVTVIALLLAGATAYAQTTVPAYPPPPPAPAPAPAYPPPASPAPGYTVVPGFPAPAPGFQTDLRAAEGEVSYVDAINRTMSFNDGSRFDFPESFSMTNLPAVGRRVKVTYYVDQDGRNIVRSLDTGYAGNRG
jgi:hypothetical protein